MSVCTWIAQDHAHLTQILSRRPIVGCPLEHWLLFGAPLWGVAFSIDMADGTISAEDSPDNDSGLSHTRTATGYKKHSWSQTAAQRAEELADERLQHIPFCIIIHIIQVPFHIHDQLTVSIFTLFTDLFFVITHVSNLLIASWLMLRCEASVYALRMPSIMCRHVSVPFMSLKMWWELQLTVWWESFNLLSFHCYWCGGSWQ